MEHAIKEIGNWLLCTMCNFSWLRDTTRPVPTACPECGAAGDVEGDLTGDDFERVEDRDLEGRRIVTWRRKPAAGDVEGGHDA